MLSQKDNRADGDALTDGLRLLRQCPVCREPYDARSVLVIQKRAEAEVLHCTCGKCHSALLALCVRSSVGMSSIATVTDLSGSDAKRMTENHILTDDDVLSFHQLLTRESAVRLFVS